MTTNSFSVGFIKNTELLVSTIQSCQQLTLQLEKMLNARNHVSSTTEADEVIKDGSEKIRDYFFDRFGVDLWEDTQ